MDQFDFDSPEYKEDLISDTGDFIGEAADSYEEDKAVPKSGRRIIAPMLLVLGFMLPAVGIFTANLYTYILSFVSLLLGYYIFSEKDKTKTTYKYNKTSRIFGAILVVATVSIIILTKYNVI